MKMKQRAFALLGPMLMLWGCLLTVGVAVYGFGDRMIESPATTAILAENTLP